MVSFDLDGVIVDSRVAIAEAYATAGVTVPDDWWGRSWRSWLPEAAAAAGLDVTEVRRRKFEAYNRFVGEGLVEPIAGYSVARRLIDEGEEVFVVTLASQWSVDAILGHLDLDVPRFATTDKQSTLRRLGARVHVDDFPLVVPGVVVVPFVDDEDDLYEAVKGATR
jgi:phosphoglycolate phosphatase-like HAD superfamily hydrolase